MNKHVSFHLEEFQRGVPRIAVRFPYNFSQVELIKQIDPRYKFEKRVGSITSTVDSVWTLPAEQWVFVRLANLFGMDAGTAAQDLARNMLSGGFNPEQAKSMVETLAGVQPERKKTDISVIGDYQWTTVPYDHQRMGLAELIENNAWGLWYDMGAGKTKIVADWLRWHNTNSNPLVTLVICPKSVIANWPTQLKLHAGMGATVIEGTAEQRRKQLKSARKTVVTNFDALVNTLDDFLEIPWDCIVADEVQHLKNATSQRSKAACAISAKCKYRRALSGTPAPNSPLDWYGILQFLDPTGRLAGTSSKTAFQARYAILRSLPDSHIKVVAGYQNLEDLHARVASVSSRVKKEDCLDLPPKIFQTRHCVLSAEQRRVYNDLRRDAVTRLVKAKEESTLSVRNILTESMRLLQVVGGFVPDDAGKVHKLKANAKLDLLRETLKELPDRPAIVWCVFREELAAIAEALTDDGRSVTVFHGDLHNAERAASVNSFQAGTADVFLSTLSAGCEGITLTAADLEIFYSRSYLLTHWLQAQDRAHRPGQTRPVDIISLIADGTVDDKVSDALEAKEQLQEAMMRTAPENLI